MYQRCKPIMEVFMYSCLLLVFTIGRWLKLVPCLKPYIITAFNKCVGTCLSGDLIWDTLFSAEMLQTIWYCMQVDNHRKIRLGSKAVSTPVLESDENNNNHMATSRLLDHAKEGRPLVLNFGSYSCPIFRAYLSEFRTLVEKYSSVADFLVVYIEEAHPSDGWAFQNDTPIPSHKSNIDRCVAAKLLAGAVNPGCKILIDSLLNASSIAYGATPTRLHVVLDGVVGYEGGPGPMSYRISEVRQWLEDWCESSKNKPISVNKSSL